MLQAILFSKQSFTPDEARKWLHQHNHHPIKRVHETTNYYRYRLRQPNKNKNHRMLHLAKNILAVNEY